MLPPVAPAPRVGQPGPVGRDYNVRVDSNDYSVDPEQHQIRILRWCGT
ncbi:Mu transposase domain-containing protein [Aeromicrobium wangtongii]